MWEVVVNGKVSDTPVIYSRDEAVQYHSGDIPDQAGTFRCGSISHAVDANIDDNCARFKPVPAHHLRSSNGGNENVRLADHSREVARL